MGSKIMLNNNTKTRLRKVAADLQKKSGEQVDFDTSISSLISQYREKEKNWDLFDEFCEPVEGLTKEELLDELEKG